MYKIFILCVLQFNKQYKITIVKYNKNITGFPNLKGMHISFIASNKYKSSCKDSLETITTNLFNYQACV